MNNHYMNPMITVVMSTYKEPEEWLRQSIESILGQSYGDFEYLIVNDCPEREENRRILNEYAALDSRICVLENDRNRGLIYSLNRGLEAAQGKYVARMDADDISLPSRFEKQVQYLEEHPECIVCGTQQLDFSGRRVKDWLISLLPHHLCTEDESCKQMLLSASCFAHPTVMMRRSTLQQSGLRYNPDFKHSEDYRLWVDLSQKGAFHNIPQRLHRYRLSPVQITKSVETRATLRQNSIRCRQAYFALFYGEDSPVVKLMHESPFDVEQIKSLKRIVGSRGELRWLLLDAYRSLRNYNAQAFLFFLLSGDVFRFSLVDVRAIVKTFFSPSYRQPLV